MKERNDAVAAMLAADAPAEHDLRFEIAMLARIAQRRLRRGIVTNMALAGTAAMLLALVMPDLEMAWQTQLAGSFSNGVIAALLFALILPLQWAMTRRA
jgi:hypothetical protein